MKQYLVLTWRNACFDEGILPAHKGFLQDLAHKGRMVMAGPFREGVRAGDAYLIKASDLEDALAEAQRDPVFISGCSEIEVQEWDCCQLA